MMMMGIEKVHSHDPYVRVRDGQGGLRGVDQRHREGARGLAGVVGEQRLFYGRCECACVCVV